MNDNDIGKRQAEQIERLARVIVRYRWQIKMLSVNGESYIPDIERDLTGDDRDRIAQEDTDDR